MGGVKHDNGKAEARYFYFAGMVPFLDDQNARIMALQYEDMVKELLKGERGRALAGLSAMIQVITKSLQDSFKISATEVLGGVSKVSKLGAEKYGLFNYQKGMDWSRLVDALGRHMTSYFMKDFIDEESTLDHRYHMLANCFMLSYYLYKDVGVNDLKETENEQQSVPEIKD